MHTDVGFNPIRIDEGLEYSLIVGSDGQMMKIDQGGSPCSPISHPFPGASSCGVINSGRWIGSWTRRDLRKAFMGSFSLDEDWSNVNSDSGGEEEIGQGNLHVSKSAIWTRDLQSEPVAMCAVGDNTVFACLGAGIYMIDSEAREIWRSPYPRWRELEDLVGMDSIVSIVHNEKEVYAFSSSGGFSIISVSSGHEVSNGILSNLPGRLHDVKFERDSGWIVMLHGRNVVLLDDLLSKPEVLRVPGPVLDASPVNGGWVWTGWRHDGISCAGTKEIHPREEIGVSLLGTKVLTNSGSWGNLPDSIRLKM